MKKLIFILFILLVSLPAISQQLPIYSQYMSNPIAINPAIAGTEKYTSLRFSSRQQWVGIEGAPNTQILSMHSRLGRTNFYDNEGFVKDKNEFDDQGNIVHRKGLVFSGKEAIGGLIFNDKNGPINKTGIQMIYAYHLVLDKMRNRFNKPPVLAIGGALSFVQFTLNESQLTLFDKNDPIISGARESVFVPDMNIGVYLYSDTYYAGISAVNMIQPRMKINGSDSRDNKLVRHLFITGGYKYETANEMIIEPSILIKATRYVPVQVDINARIYMNNINLGLSYRTNNDIIVMFGMQVGLYYFGYSFDYSVANIIQYSSGSHEIVIGINIGQSVFRGYQKQ